MSFRIGGFRAAGAIGTMLLAGSSAMSAQTVYPSFQQPRTVSREFNVGVADGERITPIIFQWREGTTPRTQLSFDVGLADSEGLNSDAFILLGGQFARTLARSSPDMPLDVLFTAGVFTMFGNDQTMLSVPVGASVGHRFPLEGTAMAITPFVHPRVALQYASADDGNPATDDSRTDLEVSFDLGGDLELTRQLALRVSATFGEFEAFGLSLAWTPRGLRTTTPGQTPR